MFENELDNTGLTEQMFCQLVDQPITDTREGRDKSVKDLKEKIDNRILTIALACTLAGVAGGIFLTASVEASYLLVLSLLTIVLGAYAANLLRNKILGLVTAFGMLESIFMSIITTKAFIEQYGELIRNTTEPEEDPTQLPEVQSSEIQN